MIPSFHVLSSQDLHHLIQHGVRTLHILDLAVIKAQGIGNVCCNTLIMRAYGAFPATLHVNDLELIVPEVIFNST